MAHRLTVPALSLVALVGVGLGVHLGRSAIAEINPAYFSSPETRFHADLSPYRSVSSSALTLGPKEPPIGLGSGCIGCESPAVGYRDYMGPAPRYESDYPSAPDPAENFVEEAPSAEPLERQARLASVERYASYPVSHEEGSALASAEPAAAPQDQREAPPLD